MNSHPTKFLPVDSSLGKVTFESLEIGKQYYLNEVVIEYHSIYDYLILVISKTDESIEVKEIYERHSDNSIYPGDWYQSEGNHKTFTRKEVETGVTENEFMIEFYKIN
jgi:hypothetical protein